jgi:hypothetical protein
MYTTAPAQMYRLVKYKEMPYDAIHRAEMAVFNPNTQLRNTYQVSKNWQV